MKVTILSHDLSSNAVMRAHRLAEAARTFAQVMLIGPASRTGAAAAITVASTALEQRFGGTLVPHGCVTELFDPARIDRESARRALGFTVPTVLFPGTPRAHKGLVPLAEAVRRIPGARLAIT